MKTRVQLHIMGAVALAAMASGCGSRGGGQGPSGTGWQTCVDKDNRVVDERMCREAQTSRAGFVPLYHWYYYPYGGRPYPMGYTVPTGGRYATAPFVGVPTPGGTVPTVGTSVPSRGGSVVRGGFGSSAARSAGA